MRQPPKGCSITGCGRPALAKSWCKTHYYRARDHNGDPLADKPIAIPSYSEPPAAPIPCKIDDCERAARTRGWCNKHYGRFLEYGDAEEPLRRARDGKGYRGLNNNGYIVLKYGPITILEHRQVMEAELGRKLYPFENVHHKNGIKTDNAPENLEVWVKVQPSGQRLEDLIAFMTTNYPTETLAALANT